MRPFILGLALAGVLAACDRDPVVEQALVDTRHDAARADTILAVAFHPGTGRLDVGQLNELRAMVAAGRAAQRDEFIVVTDGTGGTLQQLRAQQVMSGLSHAGARWVSASREPAMTMGPDRVVVVRSEYRYGMRNCPNVNPTTIANPNESLMPGFGCTDAYNFGQMLARPRDGAIGRDPGPADGTVQAEAVQRYREGRVRITIGGVSGGGAAGAPAPPSGAPPGGGN